MNKVKEIQIGSENKTSGCEGAGAAVFSKNIVWNDRVEFEPVPLPELIEVKTGEEGQEILFNERAKLMRFNSRTKKWKERGLGQMKILKDPGTGVARFLMRREQVFKVCCNHLIIQSIELKASPYSEKAWIWYAVDFAENEPKNEVLAISFRTVELAKAFKETVDTVQKQLREEATSKRSCPNSTAQEEDIINAVGQLVFSTSRKYEFGYSGVKTPRSPGSHSGGSKSPRSPGTDNDTDSEPEEEGDHIVFQNHLFELLKSIEEVARCPICLEQVSPPVSMCVNGHGTCHQCRASLSECSTCKGRFLTMQPRILEQILQLLPKPCKYSDNGCKTVPRVNDHEHELFCQFRPITCVVGKDSHCNWTGSLSTWEDHIDQSHVSIDGYCIYESMKLYHRDFRTEWTSHCYVLNVDDNLFLLFAHKIDGKFLQAVRFIPKKKPTQTHYFLFTMADKNGKEIYKYKMKATVMDKEECLENSIHCMSVPIEELECLLDKNGTLKVIFEINKKKI